MKGINMANIIPLNFKVGHTTDKNKLPEKDVPAAVPGNVQLDWAKAENYPDHNISDNFKMFGWMEDVYWRYSTKIKKPEIKNSERIYFISKGIDYEFEILLDNQQLLYQEGMFTPVNIDITDIIKEESNLDIIIYPAPKSTRTGDRSEADESVKPPVSYGWDWHPRLIVSGMYEECYLEVKPAFHIKDAEMRYTLSDDLSAADITLEAEIENPGKGSLKWELFDKNGKLVTQYDLATDNSNNSEKNFEENMICSAPQLKNPELWWPSEHGEQILYKSVFTLSDADGNMLDVKESKVGFRRCKLVPNPGAKDTGFPLSSNFPPITMEINNRRIFCKGTNWVEPEIFTGIITRESYTPLIMLAKEAHFNLLRTWGGCIVSKESFFDLCDEYGIMVWQEFPLSCNHYKDIPKYLEILDRESKSIIKRVRRHACLAMWCGGNELFNDWSGMDDQSHALRLLNANCYKLDKLTPFLPTSPVSGMGHGCYVFRYTEKGWASPEILNDTITVGEYDCLTAMVNAKNTAYTEFGCPSASDINTLKYIIPEAELFPPKPGGAWEAHHGFKAWAGSNSWLYPEVAEFYFGEPDSLEQLVEYTQMLQCIGYKGIFEEARRQYPYCSMALNWCYNEPWLTAAGNNLITYPAKPKPAYYAVRDSCRQQMASARVKKFDFENGENFEAELFILNDLPETISPLTVKATLKSASKTYQLCTWNTAETPESEHQRSDIYSVRLDEPDNCLMRMTLEVDGKPEMNSEYLFLCRNKDSTKKVLPESLCLC
jgi:beta-mannosidase